MKERSKRNANFPSIRGFECFPDGKLLNQKVDFDGPVGIAYERCIGYTKPEHSHDRITVTFPRGASHSFIKVLPEAKKYRLTEDLVHFMAKDHLHEQGSVSSVYDTFALFVTEDHYAAHLKSSGISDKEIKTFFRSTQSLTRGALLDELIARYFFCRVLEQSPSPTELAHLESFIMAEVFSISRKQPYKNSEVTVARPTEETPLVRALEFIESHLFEKLDTPALVHASRASQATLFRLFKKDLKVSPLEYVRNRRLDEARSLLKTGQYQVGDVALLVGYEELSSFSKAFKLRFRIPPSLALPQKLR